MPLPLSRKPLSTNNETIDKPKNLIIGDKNVFNKLNEKSPLVQDKDGYYRNDAGDVFKLENKKPTVKKQTATSEQIKPLDRTPKLNKPERVELSMRKPEAKESSEKTEFKQGRKFMKETGLRPGFYKEGETSDNSNKKIPIKRR